MSNVNPFHSPKSSTDGDNQLLSLRDVFFRWERWRLVYNGVLVLLVLGLLVTFKIPAAERYSLAYLCVTGGVVANGCYFAGPFAEAYLRWLGYWHEALFYLFFVGGLFATAALAALSVVSLAFAP